MTQQKMTRLERRWSRFFDLLGWSWEYRPRWRGWEPTFKLTLPIREPNRSSIETVFVWIEEYDTPEQFECHAMTQFEAILDPDDPTLSDDEKKSRPKDIPVQAVLGLGKKPSVSTNGVLVIDDDGEGGSWFDIEELCEFINGESALQIWWEAGRRKQEVA